MTDALARVRSAVRSADVADFEFRRWLIVIAIGGLVLRLWYVIGQQHDLPLTGDGWVYHYQAEGIARGKGLVSPLELSLRKQLAPTADHPPMYQLYLALWWRLGVRTPLGHMVVTSFIGVGTIFVTGYLGRRVADVRVGYVAAVFAALAPNILGWNGQLRAETMAMFWVTLTAYLTYRFWDERRLGVLALAAASAGCAALTRSELVLLLPVVLLPIMIRAFRRDLRTLALSCMVAGGAAMLVIGPWLLYNRSRFAEPVVMSTTFGKGLRSSACDTTFYGYNIGSWDLGCLALEPGRARGLDESQRDRLYRDDALAYIEAHRDRIPAVLQARLGRSLYLFNASQQVHLDQTIEQRRPWVAMSGWFTFYATASLAIGGAVILWRAKRPIVPLVGPLIVCLLATVWTYGTNRFRAPAEPALAVLAAVAFVPLFDWCVTRLRRALVRPGPAREEAGENEGGASTAVPRPPVALVVTASAIIVAVAVLSIAVSRSMHLDVGNPKENAPPAPTFPM